MRCSVNNRPHSRNMRDKRIAFGLDRGGRPSSYGKGMGEVYAAGLQLSPLTAR